MAEQNFWQRPEGRFGKWVAWGIVAAVVAAVFFGWGLVAPFVFATVQTTAGIAAYAVGLAVLGYVLVDGSLRGLLANLYKRCIRAVYILSFNVDPIGGLKERIKELRERNAYARQEAAKVRGQAQAVEQTIAANTADYEQFLQLMQTAQKMGQTDKATGASIKAGVAKEANKSLYPLKERMDRSFAMLQDIISKSDLQVDVLESVVKVKERTYNATKAGRNALRAALSAFRGDTDKADINQMNLDFVDDFVAQASGEMEAMLDLNKHALDSIDLQQQTYSDSAWAELEDRQQKVRHLLADSPQAQRLLSGAVSAPEVGTLATPQGQADFSGLFNNK